MGGDPPTRSDFADIARHLRRRGLGLGLVTDGKRLGQPRFVAGAVAKLADRAQAFSVDGLAELKSYHAKLMAKFDMVVEAVEAVDRGIAERVIQLGFKERLFERKLREAHLVRLHAAQEETVATSSLHLSVLSNLRAISDRLEAIARTVMMEL